MPKDNSGISVPDQSSSQAVAGGADVGSGTAVVATPEFARGNRVSASGRPAILDFMQNTIAGYDATHQYPTPQNQPVSAGAPLTGVPLVSAQLKVAESHKLRTCPYLGDISSALNGREKPLSDAISYEYRELAAQIAEAAIAYKEIVDKPFDASNFVQRISQTEAASKRLKDIVQIASSLELDAILVAANLNLGRYGLRIVQVSGGGEIWMGNLGENHRFSPAMRLSGADDY